MKNIINLKEFRENVAKYESRIQKGDSFIVMRRSKPLFKISPIDEEGWETVIDFTEFRKGGISASELIKILQSL